MVIYYPTPPICWAVQIGRSAGCVAGLFEAPGSGGHEVQGYAQPRECIECELVNWIDGHPFIRRNRYVMERRASPAIVNLGDSLGMLVMK